MLAIKFPTLEDREHVHRLINLYAHGKCNRNDLMRRIARIINKYPNIQRMPIFDYSVRIIQYYKDIPIISIEGARVTNKCPGCGAWTKEARYLRTEKENHDKDYDIISLTCLECGTVYMAKATNGRMSGEYF